MNITLNNELNGIEISFEQKPEATIIENLKSNGFRWNRNKKVWYAKQTEQRLNFVNSLGEVSAPAPASYNLDNLGSKKLDSYWHTDLAKAIREDLKARGVKGCTVRGSLSTHDSHITVTIKATAQDLASIEEAKERYSFNEFSFDLESRHDLYIGDRWLYYNEFSNMTEEEKEAAYNSFILYNIKHVNEFSKYHNERKNYYMLTTAFYNKCLAVLKISNQFNWDHSDSMTDYFDIGYFLDIKIKMDEDLEIREKMTEEEKKDLEAERQKEKEDFEAWQKQYEEEQKAAKEAAAKRAAYEKESEELIYNNITVEDLNEDEHIYITSLVGGIGKECNIEELNETIKDNPIISDALIDRKVIFTDEEAFNRFCNMFLNDFMFLAGKGGTGSEDVRLNDVKTLSQLNSSQRESIKFYACNCVAIYLNDELELIIDPQGYNYSRYVYKLGEDSQILTASKQLAEQKAESEEKDTFYFPEPIEKQIENINIGDEITIYQCDGWILNNVYAGSGLVIDTRPGSYAQHNGFYIDLQVKNKVGSIFIRDNNACLIYKGIKSKLPAHVTSNKINDTMTELYNYDRLIPNIYKYYKELGELPILDTFQR